jgi:phospholipid transport system substrate-binding protein
MLTRIPFLAPAAILGLWLVFTPLNATFAQAPAQTKPSAASDPTVFVDGMIQQALAVLRNTQIPDATRQQQFGTMFDKDFDVPKIARFVLGRYWTTASDADRNAFAGLFEQWIVRTYSARFKEYGGENIKVTGSRPEGDTGFVVTSQLIHPDGSPPANVNWHVVKEATGFKVVDVEVEGISMAITQRDEFSSVIQSGGGDVASLNKVLQDKLNSGAVDTAGAAPKQ